MKYIGSNIRFIFTKIKELLNSHNTSNSAHSELFKSWKRLRNPNNADIADALAATYKNGIGDVLVEVKDDTTFALEDIKLFFRPARFKLISANESHYEGIYITMDGTQGRYVAKTFADSEIMMPEGPSTISTPSELALYPAASDAVLYTPQTLTNEQQKQARTNIGALDENIHTTEVDVKRTLNGIGTNLFYVRKGWLKPCPDDANDELINSYTTAVLFLNFISSTVDSVKRHAKGAYTIYQQGLASANLQFTDNPLDVERYISWDITTNNNKTYLTYHHYGHNGFSETCRYCVEDDSYDNVRVVNALNTRQTGDNPNATVNQFYLATNPTKDMHIATKQYVDTAKTEAQQLGLTTATPGQIIKVKTVDEQGSPTAWEAVDDRLPKVSPSDAGTVLGVEQIGEHEYGYALTHMPTLSDFIPLGITNASPGQFAKVSFVDDFGNPTAWEAADIYEKPTYGIPKSDLEQSVQTSLAKADTAISYNSQTLTSAQKQQARTNIGAVSESDVNDKLPIYIKMVPGANNNEVIAEDGTTGSQIFLDYLNGRREVRLIYQDFAYYLNEHGIGNGTTTPPSLSFAACANNPSDANPNGDNVLSMITYNFNTHKFTVTTEGRYINPIDGVVKSDLSADVQKTLTNANEITKTGVGLIRYIKMVDADTTGSGIVVPDNSDETYYTIKDYINSDYTVILLYKGVPYSLNYTKVVNNIICLYYFHAIVSSDATSTVDTASEIKTVVAGQVLQFKVTTKPLYISATVSNNTLIIR